MLLRPLSFTKNLGGFRNAHAAIRKGYTPGISVQQFRRRCGLSDGQSLLVTEFLLGTQIQGDEERILADTLVVQTLSSPYSSLIARLYFFAINLNMPGERLKELHSHPADIQNELLRQYLYAHDSLQPQSFDKDRSLEPKVKGIGQFQSRDALRKWVTNYSYMFGQCGFVSTPENRLETFPDTWAALALRLFFERYAATNPNLDGVELIAEAKSRELHKLLGVPSTWLDERIAGAADMFLAGEESVFQGFEETDRERQAAAHGDAPPPPARGETQRRETSVRQLLRRSDNVRFLHAVYAGECQLSGVRLVMPDGSFSVDCAHVRPLGRPHSGEDDVSNMLSLSPTMHRLFDRGCIRINPDTLSITLLHGNDVPHRERLVLKGKHKIKRQNLAYHLSTLLLRPPTSVTLRQ